MQNARFECKYLVYEQQIPAMRAFLKGLVVPDKHANAEDHLSYHVTTLYLDNPGLVLCRGSQEVPSNRFKLRLRFYGQDLEQPVFLEIKRGVGEVAFVKQRALVTRAGAALLLRRRNVDRQYLLDVGPEAAATLHTFCALCQKVGAGGRAYVTYHREAYESPRGDQVRVTFDRQICGAPFRPAAGLALPVWRQPIVAHGVVVELKFASRLPPWLHEFVRVFELSRLAFTKYTKCVQGLGVQLGESAAIS